MKIKLLNRNYIFLLAVTAFQLCFSNNHLQQPEHKRQFGADFKEQYSGDKYQYEGIDIVTQSPTGSGEYEDYKKRLESPKEEDNNEYFSMNLDAFSWIFYIAIIGAVIFLAYILINEGGAKLFSSNRNKTIHSEYNITAENIEETDIDAFIANAEKSGDYRLAIRYYYLLVLKHLSLKNHIKIEEDKTNSEYLTEINGKPFSKGFEYTSYLYNYIWYGEFPLSNQQYLSARTNFITLLKQVK